MTATAHPGKRIHDAHIVRQHNYGSGYFVMELACPELAHNINEGQFVNVRTNTGTTPFLRRPFSVFELLEDTQGQATGISLLYHIVGTGTRIMSTLAGGQSLSLLGPLGRAFAPPPDAETSVVMVGGGIGLAPFHLQAHRLLTANPARDCMLIAGGRSERDLRYLTRFEPLLARGMHMMVTTEDGSAGLCGRVTLGLAQELEAARKQGRKSQVYCCGPTPMMRAVSEMCLDFGVPCFASLENVMACGYGVCNGCVVRIKDDHDAQGFRYEKVCSKGSLFDADTIVWA